MTIRAKERADLQAKAMDLAYLVGRAVGSDAVPPTARGVSIKQVCDDSRHVRPGALFVAVSGTHVHGAAFADDAVSRGAAAVVADRGVVPVVDSGPMVVEVADARSALARLASVFYGVDVLQASGELRVAGVTGTNGKSTVAYMLRSLLRATGRTPALLGTIEYDLVGRTLPAGLTTPGPVALARHLAEAHRAGARDVVMEVSSHSLAQCRTDGIDVSRAIFTNLSQDHLDYHSTFESYLQAKRRLFDRLSPQAVAVVNADDPAAERMVENCQARIVRFGTGGDVDVRATILSADRTGGRFMLENAGKAIEVHTPMVGPHNIANALAAAAAGLAMGLDLETIRRGLADLTHVPGRLQRIETDSLGFDVYVDYAHTDDALRRVLQAIRPLTRGRLWCVFGCGGDRDRTKRPRMARAAAEEADVIVITSDNPRTEDPSAILADIERGLSAEDRSQAITEPDRGAAIGYAIERLSGGDALVIAGKGHEDYQILGARKVHFDDAQVAREAIQRRRGGGPRRPGDCSESGSA